MQPSLKKNYIYRVFYEILKVVTPFITTPYVARVLEADGVGNYSYTHTYVTYFMLFAALGTLSYGTREIAQNRDSKEKASKLFWEIEILSIITSCISLIAWTVFILVSTENKLLYIALTPFLLSTLFDISWFFTGYENVKTIVVRNSAIKIIGILMLFLLVKRKEDIVTYCLINSCVALFGNLSMWFYLPKMLVKVDFRNLHLGHHFHETLIYFIPTIATSVYTLLDKTLIGLMTTTTFQNGYYEEATKIIGIVNSVVFMAVNSVMGARISYLFADNRTDEIKEKINHTIDFVYLLGFGSVFGLLGIAERFVPTFFGEGYEPVIQLLYIISPLILIIGTSNCLGNLYYTPSGKRKQSAKVIVLGAIVNLCLNLILIPHLGAIGATIASIVAELTIAVIYVCLCSGYTTWRDLWNRSYKRIVAGFAMMVVVIMLGKISNASNLIIVFLQIALGALLYAGVLLLEKDKMIYELKDICVMTVKKQLKRL